MDPFDLTLVSSGKFSSFVLENITPTVEAICYSSLTLYIFIDNIAGGNFLAVAYADAPAEYGYAARLAFN